MKDDIHARARELLPEALTVSHRISDRPELAFEEFFAAELLTDLLRRHGFTIEKPVAGLATAFVATSGGGDGSIRVGRDRPVRVGGDGSVRVGGDGPVRVGLCAEYDALPNIGHACGHNIIAAAAVLCAVALSPLLADVGVELRVLGTPAEEGGGGKVTMLEEGVFDGLDAALMVHPAPHDMLRPSILAMEMLDVEFHGFRPPSMNPELGYSAGDGVTLVQVGVGLMRQHLHATDRITGVILEEGFAANALPDRARMRFVLRAPTIAALAPVRERFVNVVNGAALASGTTCSITSPHPAYDGMRHDGLLSELYGANARALGRSFPDESAADAARSASTDFGNVSQRVRAIHPLIGVQSDGFSNHQAEFTDICRSATGDDAVFAGAVAMAWTIVDFAAQWVSSHREQEA